jgi:Na+/H+-dicarboxylate symporter
MLKIVFISIMIGIALLKVAPKEAEPVIHLIQGLNSTVIHLVHLIMLGAPIGVFALMANTITSLAGDNPGQIMELIRALGFYCFTVILALSIQAAVVYPAILHFLTPMPLKRFFSGIAPAQLVEFSTSSSGATMPVTMEQCEKKLGVSEEITSFVIPLGATINMDGTALYQAVAAVFIAQVSGIELTMGNQITIILTAVLASIGTAAVPGAGIIMLVIILQSINVPAEGIALIHGVDRILDMIRTTVNITGDAAVATLVASGENQLDLSKTVPTKTGP